MSNEFMDACEHFSDLANWTYREKLQLRVGLIIGALIGFGVTIFSLLVSSFVSWIIQ